MLYIRCSITSEPKALRSIFCRRSKSLSLHCTTLYPLSQVSNYLQFCFGSPSVKNSKPISLVWFSSSPCSYSWRPWLIPFRPSHYPLSADTLHFNIAVLNLFCKPSAISFFHAYALQKVMLSESYSEFLTLNWWRKNGLIFINSWFLCRASCDLSRNAPCFILLLSSVNHSSVKLHLHWEFCFLFIHGIWSEKHDRKFFERCKFFYS